MAGAALLLASCSFGSPTTPVGLTETTISAAGGGELKSADGRLKLTFPPGSVGADIRVSAVPLTASQLPAQAKAAGKVGGGYSLQPDGTRFAKPVAVTYTLGKADLAELDPSKAVPFLGLTTGAPGGALSSVDGSESETNWDAGSMTLTGSTGHFSQIIVAKLADYTFTPSSATSFVGDPGWTVSMTFTNPYSFPINVTGLAYGSNNPPIGRPGLISAPDFTVPGHGSGNLASSPPTFDCSAVGDGYYWVDLHMDALGENGFALGPVEGPPKGRSPLGFRIVGDASCVEPPVLKADLQPPSTIFAVSFPKGPPKGPVSYSWQGAIGCGTFAPFAKRPTDFRPGDAQARWTHPNAPDPSRAREDLDGDGVFDFCPHSEEANFTHPGTVSVRITFQVGTRLGVHAASVLCTYSGSLSGTGNCRAEKA